MKFESMKDWRTWKHNSQVFAVDTVYIKIAGDFVAGCVLSQIDYWFKPTADGGKESRGGIERDGYTWLVKKRAEYEEWIGLKPKELDTALNHLRRTGLIVTASHFFKDADDTEATKHLYVRINDPVFVERLNRIAQSGEVQASKFQTQDISSKSPNQDLQTNSPTEDLSASPNPQTRIYKPSKSPNREDKIIDYYSENTQTEITGLAPKNSAATPPEIPAAKPSKPETESAKELTGQQILVGAFADAMGVKPNLKAKQIGPMIARLRKTGLEPSPEVVMLRYGLSPPSDGGWWWYTHDWRGQKGQRPGIEGFEDTWGAWELPAAPVTAKSNGHGKVDPITAAKLAGRKVEIVTGRGHGNRRTG